MLFGGKKTFERLTQAVGKHLHSGGGNMFTLPLESTLKVIFVWKCLRLLVLLLDRLKHAIIDDARLTQASHEQAGLFLIWVDPILKCFHVFFYTPLENGSQPFRPPAGGQQFTHLAEASGPLTAY
jgi:hypothetical protein